jgi:Tfp pilus assembly protein PilV
MTLVQGNLNTSKIKKSLKGISLIEALVSVVVVGIGFVSILQMAVYATRSVDIAIEKNKSNFIAEMMMESIVADKRNAQNYRVDFKCDYQLISGGTVSDRVKNFWLSSYDRSLNQNRCLSNDIKQTIMNVPNGHISINFHLGDGAQRKYLGLQLK